LIDKLALAKIQLNRKAWESFYLKLDLAVQRELAADSRRYGVQLYVHAGDYIGYDFIDHLLL
jgi:hypothetical protein